jgi:Cdc6-like AAA superfamily ATPase
MDTARIARLTQVLRPGAPIDRFDLFRGRSKQLLRVNQAVNGSGRHAVIFGERGVGKTSLAAVSAELLSAHGFAVRVNCDGANDFQGIWQNVIDVLVMQDALPRQRPLGFHEAIEKTVEILSFGDLTPGRVRQALRVLSEPEPAVLFLDEFDRVTDHDARSLLADTIKGLSDQLIGATLVIVGVADDVDALIEGHASVSRSLVEVRMPRMDLDELQMIVVRGLDAVQMTIADNALSALIHLPQGLPHYAHLLAQQAAINALMQERNVVEERHVRYAIAEAVESSDETLTREYVLATDSAHKDALYETVLLACALAPVDDLGFFAPGELRTPLKAITGEDFTQDRYQNHLVRFVGGDRGPILERRGGERRWRYRFADPKMRPYVVMRALNSGAVKADVLGLPVPSEPGQLF